MKVFACLTKATCNFKTGSDRLALFNQQVIYLLIKTDLQMIDFYS